VNENQEIIDQPAPTLEMVVDGFSNKWDRIRHFVVDGGLIIALSMLIYYQVYEKYFMYDEDWNYTVGFSILLTIYFFYYLLFEKKLNQTPGKMINKTLVVTDDLEKLTWLHVLKRTVIRFPFAFAYNTILDAPFHDIFSKTRVIRVKRKFKIEDETEEE
jgi:uncharacterized RDD family membrane protein YckC